MNEAVSFESLSWNAMQLSAKAIVDAADLAFLLWPDGQIAEASLGTRTGLEIDTNSLVNRDVAEIVHPQDAAQITDLVAKARNGQRPRPVKMRHSPLIQDGTVALYSAHMARDGKNIMLLGSALSAELALSAKAAHAEIAKHKSEDREISEARYRLLFESSSEGLLVVDRASGLIEQSNGNASALIGRSEGDLIGTPLWSHFADDPDDLPNVGDTSSEFLKLKARLSATGETVRLTAHTVRSFLGTMLIVRLNRIRAPERSQNDDRNAPAVELLRRTSVPVLLTDKTGKIGWCNTAFAALVSNTRIVGAPVAEVLGISSHALDLVLHQANTHGRAPTSLSSLDSRLAIAEDAHLTIVSIPDNTAGSYGFLVHMMDKEKSEPGNIARPETSALAGLVGEAPLKDLVRKSTTVIERGCIEAALRLTGNNRAAAANALGLSRQSLYLKIREHNLG